MRRFHAALFAASILLTFALTTAFSQEKAQPTRIGFLDVKKAFDTYRKPRDAQAQIKAQFDALSSDFKQRATQIEQTSEKLNTMSSGSEDYERLQREIALAKETLKYDREAAGHRLEQEQAKRKNAIYKEISQEAENFGKEHGFAAVLLYIPPETDFDRDVDMFIVTRAVLCRDDSLDVTKDVVERLNALLPPAPPAPAPAKQK
jgi:Skp family chaperone for outer membrane proteins